ncbi:hypothetical protein GH714_011993 [Hevea brasiliensis]|uniref:TYRAAT2-like C-terminal domain-containing protein n=1 Tax=Hevea brasiliensis TaxID=3981 RepID=A0A6A6MY89_HEVBR|nr:hypothetical protein GH714_011993 [Hevea brasiliensis]
MVESSSAENDWRAAGSQFITHTMGRVLGKLGLESTPVNAKGYETLIKLVENAAEDSFDLYYGLYEQLERSDLGFKSLKKQLFGLLHDVLRKQLFENAEKSQFFSFLVLLRDTPWIYSLFAETWRIQLNTINL